MSHLFNLTHLKYFVDAVETGSLTLASQLNCVTHSTISQGIKRFEESLGTRLLEHNKRTFKLTSEGEFLLEPCLQVLKSSIHLQNQCGKTSKPVGKLVFASSQSLLSNFILKKFSSFREKYPNVSIQFEIGRTQEIKKMITSRQVEFGITIDDGKLSPLEIMKVKSGQFILVYSTLRRETENKNVFITTRERPETLVLARTYREKYKKNLSILYEVDSWNLVKTLAQSGEGIGLIPDFAFNSGDGLKKLSWSPNARYDLVVAHRNQEALSGAAEKFIEQL